MVFAGNGIVAENGRILRESGRFRLEEQLVVADIDIQRLEFERRRNTSFRMHEGAAENTVIEMEVPEGLRAAALDRDIDPMPFVPQDEAHRSERCEEIFQIQSHGLAKRLVHTRCEKAVIGISGGLDSTLALLVTVRTFDKLGLDRAGIIGITMPGFGTTDRTYDNALELMRERWASRIREIHIRDAVRAALQRHRPRSRRPLGVTYENSQARERTQMLMDVANHGGRSGGRHGRPELSWRWAGPPTTATTCRMYGVNASVPKTLVRHLVHYVVADTESDDGRARDAARRHLDTPVSPELLPADKEGKIAQKTEDLVGPYELHDFFLYNFIRCRLRPG